MSDSLMAFLAGRAQEEDLLLTDAWMRQRDPGAVRRTTAPT